MHIDSVTALDFTKTFFYNIWIYACTWIWKYNNSFTFIYNHLIPKSILNSIQNSKAHIHILISTYTHIYNVCIHIMCIYVCIYIYVCVYIQCVSYKTHMKQPRHYWESILQQSSSFNSCLIVCVSFNYRKQICNYCIAKKFGQVFNILCKNMTFFANPFLLCKL